MTIKKKVDFLWKIVLCGDAYVGKTSIRKKSMGEKFTEEYISTVGADFSSYKFQVNDLRIGYQVWDLAGQGKYKYIRSSFYGGATGCFLVYDVTNQETLTNLISWIDEAIRYSNGTIEIFIVCGNKIDLEEDRVISREMGEKFTETLRESSGLQCEYIETSALTGENISEAFDLMAQCLLEREGIAPREIPEKGEIEKEKAAEEGPLFSKAEVEEDTSEIKVLTKDEQGELPAHVSEEIAGSILDEDLSGEKVVSKTSPPLKEELQELVEDEDQTTDELIAEVLEILEDTDGIIIGKEIDEQGEKMITMTKNQLTKKAPSEEAPQIDSSLERVLYKINDKLESLTKRLDGLEKEISSIQYKETIPQATKEKAKYELEKLENELKRIKKEGIASSPTELEVAEETSELPAAEEVAEETSELPAAEEVAEEKKLPETITKPIQLSLSPPPSPKGIESMEEVKEETAEVKEETAEVKEETTEVRDVLGEEDFDEFRILENLVEMEEAERIDEELAKKDESDKIVEEELVDVNEEEPSEIISKREGEEIESPTATEDEEKDSEEEVIGTELSSAMISELKTISQQSEVGSISEKERTPFRVVSEEGEKKFCPICGQELKFIRQYNKFYCTQCGRYII
ncbi:MAG: GTP-binding protein [Candidatus Heimdallarchaeota archaeon]|nr:GTP-binding protein [Candidatus Heimdallarchaeota archaeon]